MARLLVYFGILLVVLQSCLPKPGHPLEWLHREDAIIVQRRTVEPTQPSIASWTAVPDFTLYGDGTLIIASQKGESGLARGRLPEDAVRDLIEFVDGVGFFNFNYALPSPKTGGPVQTTYFYVALKDRANAVAVDAIYMQAPNGRDWSQFRKLQNINDRLDAINPQGSDAPTPYDPDAVLLLVEPTSEAGVAGSALDWPYSDIDLNAIAPTSSGQVRRIEGDSLRSLVGAACPGPFKQGDRYFIVCYRPVLPFEENFPEFDAP